MFEQPEVIAAIVAAITSLIVSAVSGSYTVLQNRKRFEALKREILTKYNVENFIEARGEYLRSFRKFEHEINLVNKRNPDDGTEAIQLGVDFLSSKARDFYLVHSSFFKKQKDLDELLNKNHAIY